MLRGTWEEGRLGALGAWTHRPQHRGHLSGNVEQANSTT
jgi:hypothetical protein